jgi:hypothetical protein
MLSSCRDLFQTQIAAQVRTRYQDNVAPSGYTWHQYFIC